MEVHLLEGNIMACQAKGRKTVSPVRLVGGRE